MFHLFLINYNKSIFYRMEKIMLVTLMRRNRINKVILSKSNKNDEWICDNNSEKLVKIEKYYDLWMIKSNSKVKIIKR